MSRPRSRLGLGSRGRSSSNGSVAKLDLVESPKEKAKFKINTKADPTKAINEVQPSQLQVLGETTINPLRSMEHRDGDGNVITDPDLSNPTRPRLERPLDTIRSFEAAIDGGYDRRQSYRPASANPLSSQNRRSGFFNGYPTPQRNTYENGGGGGYYGNRHSMSHSRAESYVDAYGPPPNQQGANRRFGPRNHSDPALYGRSVDASLYQSHGHQQSYDTVGTTSNGSHATDQWGNSTDPSSENSSIDKYQPPPPPHAPPKQDLGEVYGFNGFGGAPQFQGPILEEYSHDTPAQGETHYGQSSTGYHDGYGFQANNTAPNVPPHRAPAPPPKEIQPKVLPKSMPAPVSRVPEVSNNSEKRRSWIKRRFSRS